MYKKIENIKGVKRGVNKSVHILNPSIPSLSKSFQTKMNNHEELVQAKMAEIYYANEEKKRILYEKEIEIEALLRIETDKLNYAINYNDIEILRELAGTGITNDTYIGGSPCIIVKNKAIKYREEQYQKAIKEQDKKNELQQIAKEAFDSAQKQAQEKKKQMKLLIRLAFESYYSRNINVRGLFKKRQKELIDGGVTAQHFDDPTINCIRQKSSCQRRGVCQCHLVSGAAPSPCCPLLAADTRPPCPMYLALTAEEKPYGERDHSWARRLGAEPYEWIEPFDSAQTQAQKKKEQMKLLIRLAFESYCTGDFNIRGLFKKRQKELIDGGVTAQHFDDPTINCIRENSACVRIGLCQCHLVSGAAPSPCCPLLAADTRPPFPMYLTLTAEEKTYGEIYPSWVAGLGTGGAYEWIG